MTLAHPEQPPRGDAVPPELLHGRHMHEPSLLHHPDLVGDRERQSEVLLDEQHADALGSDLAQNPTDLAHNGRGQAVS